MRVLKKGFAYLSLAVLMLFSHSIEVHANEIVEIVIGNTEGAVGERIQIPISLKNSAEVGGMDFSVIYDSQELKYIKAQRGSCAKEANLCDIHHRPEQSSIRYVYASLNTMPEDGEILSVTFEVLKEMETPHTVSVTVKDVLDMEIQELSYVISGGRTIEPSDAGVSEKDIENDGEMTVNIEANETETESSATINNQKDSDEATEEMPEETPKKIILSKEKASTNQSSKEHEGSFLLIAIIVAAFATIVLIFWKRFIHKK